MRSKNRIRTYILIFIVLCIIGFVSYFPLKRYYHTSWTFAFYLNGNNNLEREETKNFIEIVRGKKYAERANLLVCLNKDDTLSNDNPMTVWTGTRVFEVSPDYETTIDNPLSIGTPARSEGDAPAVHSSCEAMGRFFSFVMDHYPADRYAFFISGHGNGWFFKRDKGCTENAPAGDGSSGEYRQNLDPVDIAAVLRHSRPDVLVLDMCLMADIETLYQLRLSTDYLVANQTIIPSTTLDYSLLFKRIKSGRGLSPKRLAREVVQTYESSYGGSQYTMTTVAVHFGKEFHRFIEDFSRFVQNKNNRERLEGMVKSVLRIPRWNDTSRDMIDLVQYVYSSKDKTLISYMPGGKHSFITGEFSNRSQFGGISIYLPAGKNRYLLHRNEYDMLDISRDYPDGWKQYLERTYTVK
jgi:hypothetical protein